MLLKNLDFLIPLLRKLKLSDDKKRCENSVQKLRETLWEELARYTFSYEYKALYTLFFYNFPTAHLVGLNINYLYNKIFLIC